MKIIEVNNKQKLEICTAENGVKVTLIDSNNQPERTQTITDGEIVTLLNWYNYQKQIGNKELNF